MICYPIGAFDEGSSVGFYGYEFVHAQVKLGEWKKKFKVFMYMYDHVWDLTGIQDVC